MSKERPRFTLQITLRDRNDLESMHMAVDLDDECGLRISARSLEIAKAGFGHPNELLTMMKFRSRRKEILTETALRLGQQLAERMEDAEGWHDASRIEPARKQLGGRW